MAMAELSPLVGPGAAPSSPNDEIELRPAKFNDRFIAYFLDLVPFMLGYAVTLYVLFDKLVEAEDIQAFLTRFGVIWIGLYALYQFAGNALGGTVGKKLMGLRVVKRDGTPLGIPRSFIRAIGTLLSTPFFNFGFLLALLNAESRALHDFLSGSLVVEDRVKHPAESFLFFICAVLTCVSTVGGSLYYQLNLPTKTDLAKVAKAREGLQIIAQIQESYKKKNGEYTKSIADLAEESGDVVTFRDAMLKIFQPDRFQIRAGLKGYKITAIAKDRHKTRVSITGP